MPSDLPPGWGIDNLGALAVPVRETVDPQRLDDPLVEHFSLPAFDVGEAPEVCNPRSIGSAKQRVPDGVVLVARLNPQTPRVWMPQDPACRPRLASTEFAVLRPNAGVDRRFLLHTCRSPQFVRAMLALRAGTTGSHQRVRPDDLLAIDVAVPPLDEQRRIADVLSALDDKARSCQRAIAVAGAAIRSAFEHLLSRDGRSWDRSWPHAALGSHLEVVETGRRPPGGVAGIQHGVPSIGAESIVGAGHFDYSKAKLVPDEFFASMRRGVLADGDVLLYKDGGRPGAFEPHVSFFGCGFPYSQAAINEHVYRLRIGAPFSQEFLYAWLSSDFVMEELRRRGTGVAVPGLNQTNLASVPLVVPDQEPLAAAQAVAKPMMEGLLTAARHRRTLVEVRDALLPELLAGRLRVPEAA